MAIHTLWGHNYNKILTIPITYPPVIVTRGIVVGVAVAVVVVKGGSINGFLFRTTENKTKTKQNINCKNICDHISKSNLVLNYDPNF